MPPYEEGLRPPGPGPEVAKVRDGSIDLHVEVYGGQVGRPGLVFIPGDAVYTTYFRPFLEGLAAEGFVVLAFDPMGHGRSGGDRGVFTMAGLIGNARAVIDLLVDEFTEKVGIVGTGTSADVALFTGLVDDRVRSIMGHALTLAPILGGSPGANTWLVGGLGRLVMRLLPDRPVPLERILAAGAVHEDPEVVEYRLRDPLVPPSWSLSSYRSLLADRPSRPLSELSAPVLVLAGERDRVVAAERGLAAFRHLPGPKELYVMPGGGHQLLMERTEASIGVAAAWFEKTLR